MTTKIISIEGNIGSGKSTLIAKLKEQFVSSNVIFIAEPVDIWTTITSNNGENILEKFYKNQEQYAFPFQMSAYISRLHLIKQSMKTNPNRTIIIERSCFTDKNVFAKMLYDMVK
jgi:deoxyadenosine/deoxycytidine kinase